jgi:hypothetical protein
MILTGDPVLEDLIFLSLESGNSFLSFTPPLAPHEVKIFLNLIDTSLLSPAAQDAYNRVRRKLLPQANIMFSHDIYLFTLNINSTLETSTRFNSGILWYPKYPKVPPLFSFPFKFYFSDSLQLYFEPIIAVDPQYYRGSNVNIYSSDNVIVNSGNFSHNVPAGLHNLDQNLPLRAFLTAGGSWWNFQLGRDRLSYGTGQLGNLAISDNPSFYEFARLSFFSRFFKYSAMVSQMPMDVRGIIKNADTVSDNTLLFTTQRHLYLHRLDFSVRDRLSVSLTEGVMVGNSPLEIRYLNPLMVFHSLYSFWNYPKWDEGIDPPTGSGDMNGSLFSLEVNWNIIRSLAFYGQFVMNQIATPYKIENWERQPNGMGYLAGMRYSTSFNNWGSVFYLEFIYTDPYLYMNPSPFASHINMRYLGITPGRFQYSFFGFQRDTIASTFGVNLFNNQFNLSFNIIYLLQGEHDIIWNWDLGNYDESTPTGIAENKIVTALEFRWKYNQYITFKGGISAIVSINNRNIQGTNAAGGQAFASVNFHY